jgi:hypothetical protein
MEDNNNKFIIYQAFPRWFGNNKPSPVKDGSLPSNGSGKFRDFTDEALAGIRELGTTHIWLTGIIEHATKTNYSAYGIKRDHAAVVKGNAGSPYAIKDYYDVDPDLSVNVYNRMNEFEALGGTDSQSRHEGDHRLCRQSCGPPIWLGQQASLHRGPRAERQHLQCFRSGQQLLLSSRTNADASLRSAAGGF